MAAVYSKKRMSKKNIVVYVMNVTEGMAQSLREAGEKTDRQYRVMLLWDSRRRKLPEKGGYDILVECDFSKPHKIAEALLPYQDQLLAITCRGDNNVSYFREVIPHVPYLRTPTTESLTWATDKYEMRKRFRLYDQKITPIFTKVKENSKEERDRLINKVGLPMIIKPANLGASLFVAICYHEEELKKTLDTIFRKIKKAYKNDRRFEEPTIMAEQYMEGDMYSVDSYVDGRGNIYHCPLVRTITGKEIGHDDFYGYKQTTPTILKKETVARAEATAETAIHALGLRSTSAHTELMKIDNDWKVIEVGPRLGGFRDVLHRLSCDINHTANDVMVRIPRKPVIPKKCKGFSTAIKWFVAKEGKIVEMKGIKKIESLESFHSLTINKKVGDRAVFARNGGRSVFNLLMYNKDRSRLLADIRRMEQMVKIKVEVSRGRGRVERRV